MSKRPTKAQLEDLIKRAVDLINDNQFHDQVCYDGKEIIKEMAKAVGRDVEMETYAYFDLDFSVHFLDKNPEKLENEIFTIEVRDNHGNVVENFSTKPNSVDY